ncbi:DUF411 domain-containing protein [Ottowia testudinis]|uniref:DUF411 domain-containing protein n=1 Tax=Ottowia testudinis TaxID=2816950 RepID=A0A975CHD7_9BURK|nr:DUF411 domain-containing protein [Ottowia testudinis]QTD45116.1 DUF411 domain-containing protein [Ottowia testudinis]
MNSSHPCRRRALGAFAAAAGAALLPSAWAQKRVEPARVELWKDASCGCCGDWISHMKQHGFTVTAHDTGHHAVRARLGLAARYGSCHTALVGGYVVEGHVHADDVRRLLREKPMALGLAVPGMPVGSPGMDGPVYGGRRDKYDTLLVLRDGSSQVFRSHS